MHYSYTTDYSLTVTTPFDTEEPCMLSSVYTKTYITMVCCYRLMVAGSCSDHVLCVSEVLLITENRKYQRFRSASENGNALNR